MCCCSPPVKEVVEGRNIGLTASDKKSFNQTTPANQTRRRSEEERQHVRIKKWIIENGTENPPKMLKVCLKIQPMGRRLTHTNRRALLIKAKPFVKYATLIWAYHTKEMASITNLPNMTLFSHCWQVCWYLHTYSSGCRCGARWGCLEKQTQLLRMSRNNTGNI